MKVVNKREFIDQLRIKLNTTEPEAREIYHTFIELVVDNLAQNKSVRLTDFGKFEVKDARLKNNLFINDQDRYNLEYHYTVKFIPFRTFKKNFNKNYGEQIKNSQN